MKIFTTLLFVGALMFNGIANAQNIAAWDFFGTTDMSATVAAEVYNANLDASNLVTRGAGATASTGLNSFRTQGFQNNGIAVTNTDYFQVTLSAATGYKTSLSTIYANLKGTASFGATPGVSMQFAYSLDGTTFNLIGLPTAIVGGTGTMSVDVTGVSALQNVPAATTITLRYYASGQTATGGWGFFSNADNDYGLSVAGTVVVDGIPCPTLAAPVAPAVSTCSGSTAVLTATPSQTGSTLNWYDVSSGGIILDDGATYETTNLNTQTSFWVEEVVTGCPPSPRTEVVVSIYALPVVNAGADQTVCSGANVTLSGSGASTYTWNNGVTNGTAFAATATTTYTVTGTDANGCIGTDNVTVTVSGTAPTVNAGPDQSICAGTSTSLTATGAGTFTWDNGVSQAAPFTPTTTMTYTVTVDNGVCTNTDQVVIVVSQPSVAGTISVSDMDACLNDILTGTITGNTGSVEWFVQPPGFPMYTSAGTGTTLTTTPVPLAGSYLVKAQVTSGACAMVTSNILTVVVNALPTVNGGADQAVCANTPVTLNGAGASTYTWNNSVTNNVAFTPTATATYTVTGTDVHGCVNTDNVTVTVKPLPTVNAGLDQETCAGNGVVLAGSGTATSYTWNNGVTNNTGFNATATATYTVTGTLNGCTSTDQVTVTVNPLPVITTTVSGGTTITAASTPAAQSYQWIECTNNQPTGPTTASFSPTANGSYGVIVTTADGCQATSTCVSITSLGLEDTKAEAGFNLFPNPTKGKVTLSMGTNESANVIVYNSLGKVVATVNHAQNGTVIDLSNNPAGVYMIQVSGEKGSSIYRVVRN